MIIIGILLVICKVFVWISGVLSGSLSCLDKSIFVCLMDELIRCLFGDWFWLEMIFEKWVWDLIG